MFICFWVLLFMGVAGDSAPRAMITARAVLPRDSTSEVLFGWYSAGTTEDGTQCRDHIPSATLAYCADTAFIGYAVMAFPSISTSLSFWVDYCSDLSSYCHAATSCGGGSLYFDDPRRTPDPWYVQLKDL